MALDALAVIFLGRPLPCLRATLPVSFIFLTLYLIVLIGTLVFYEFLEEIVSLCEHLNCCLKIIDNVTVQSAMRKQKLTRRDTC